MQPATIGGIAIAVIIALLVLCCGVYFIVKMEKEGRPMFKEIGDVPVDVKKSEPVVSSSVEMESKEEKM